MFQRALDRLDAAMIAAGESTSTIGGGVGSSVAGAGAVTGRRSSSRISGSRGGDFGKASHGVGTRTGSAAVVAMAAVAQQSSRLIFDMFYLTDELLYYALKHEGFVGEFALRLANLVYSIVFRHEVSGDSRKGRGRDDVVVQKKHVLSRAMAGADEGLPLVR